MQFRAQKLMVQYFEVLLSFLSDLKKAKKTFASTRFMSYTSYLRIYRYHRLNTSIYVTVTMLYTTRQSPVPW